MYKYQTGHSGAMLIPGQSPTPDIDKRQSQKQSIRTSASLLHFPLTFLIPIGTNINTKATSLNMTKSLTIEVGPSDVQGETRARRSTLSPNDLISTPSVDVKTLYDVLQHSAKVRPNLNAIGFRKTLKVVEEEKESTKVVDGEIKTEKKKWKYFQLSSYQWMTYKDSKIAVDSIGSGLRHFGAQPKDNIAVFGSTR